MSHPRERKGHESGFTLIIVILVLAFLLAVGAAVVSVTGTGTKIADNIRGQDQSLNAAEAGFDSAWQQMSNAFDYQNWTSFDTHYLKDPAGIDLPIDANYFRRLTDQELLALLDQNNDGLPDSENVIYFKQSFVQPDSGIPSGYLTYTVFLIDKCVGAGLQQPGSGLLVIIGTAGTGKMMSTTRLEVELTSGE
jgi:hypothetical protein